MSDCSPRRLRHRHWFRKVLPSRAGGENDERYIMSSSPTKQATFLSIPSHASQQPSINGFCHTQHLLTMRVAIMARYLLNVKTKL